MIRNFYEQLSKDQVKELCFVIHNGKTEEERNHAKWKLAYSYEKPLYFKCCKYFKLFHKNIDEDELYDIVHDCLYVLFKKAENYDPEKGATLYTYARNELKKTFFMKTNPGMTETQIRNFNRIYTAKKHYELIHKRKWTQTEDSLMELSNICGLSVKVITKTLKLKKELYKKDVHLDALIKEGETTSYGDNSYGDNSYGDDLKDNRYSEESYFEMLKREEIINKFYRVINSFSEEEKDIFCTWVDMDTYELLSEREGIRRLEEIGVKMGRGTLNSRREALKLKLYKEMYDTYYCFVA